MVGKTIATMEHIALSTDEKRMMKRAGSWDRTGQSPLMLAANGEIHTEGTNRGSARTTFSTRTAADVPIRACSSRMSK